MLLVEDVVTTGGSAAEVVELVSQTGGKLRRRYRRSVGIRVDPSRKPLGATLRALIRVEAKSWPAESCPLSPPAGVPLDDPGSRRLGA